MTLARKASTWALRGMVLWAAMEAALALYDEGAREAAMLAEIKTHRATMARIETRATESARTLAEERARLRRFGTLPAGPPGVEPSAAISGRVQAELFALGAAAPMLQTSVSPLGGGLTRITLDTRWREGRETSPDVLYGLTTQSPALAIETLTLERLDTDEIEARARLQTIAAPQ